MSTNLNNKDGTLTTLANGTRVWIGTKAAHQAQVNAGTMPSNVLVCQIDAYDNGSEIYSTTEQKVGTWIDGKPIYRKVIESTLSTGSNDIIHNLSIARYINVFISKGEDIVSGSSAPQQTHAYLSSEYSLIPHDLRMNHMSVSCNGWTGYAVIILEYTKTTD